MAPPGGSLLLLQKRNIIYRQQICQYSLATELRHKQVRVISSPLRAQKCSSEWCCWYTPARCFPIFCTTRMTRLSWSSSTGGRFALWHTMPTWLCEPSVSWWLWTSAFEPWKRWISEFPGRKMQNRNMCSIYMYAQYLFLLPDYQFSFAFNK